MILSNEQRAWLAGVLDGEGCIRLRKLGGGFKMTNTNLAFITQVALLINGKVTKYRNSTQPTHLPYYETYAYGSKAKVILEQLLPYLIIKVDKAKELIAKR